jgi:hypothetical protein
MKLYYPLGIEINRQMERSLGCIDNNRTNEAVLPWVY